MKAEATASIDGELSFHNYNNNDNHNVNVDCDSAFTHTKLSPSNVRLHIPHPQSICSPPAVRTPVASGVMIGTRNYVMKVGIGTPAMDVVVIMDTASDLGWIQCIPCLSCYTQLHSFFNASHSSSYAALTCASPLCTQLPENSRTCSPVDTCNYGIHYGDSSIAAGDLATETLTLAGDKIARYAFGCGHDNEGLFHGADGVLGLGRGQLSFLAQTSTLFHNRFSYCLPSSPSTLGFVEFGQQQQQRNNGFTPLILNPTYPSFYFVKVQQVTMGGQVLPLDTSFTPLIDSGTVITRLPSGIYIAARDAFRKATASLPGAESPDPSFLDTCYDLSGFRNRSIKLPLLSVHMDNGLLLTVPAVGMLVQVDETAFTFCFAFAEASGGSLSILGNTQQQGMEMAFDLHASTLSIQPHAC